MIVTSVQIKTAKTQKHLYCPVFTLKPHRSDAVLFYADIKTLKGLKPLSAYSAKQNTGPFRTVLKVR